MMNFFKKAVLAASLVVTAASTFAEDKPVLRVATEPSFAPFEVMDPNSQELVGFDIDVINAIAELEGYATDISSMPFDGQIPAIVTGQIDVAISGFTITKEREKIVNFTEPYYNGGLGALVNKKVQDIIKTAKDLEGKAICAQIGTSGAMYAQQIPGAVVTQFNTASEAFMELNKGTCIASVNDKPVLEYYLATTGNENLYLLNDYFTHENLGIVTSKKNKKLSDQINDGLKKIKANGTYDKLYKKWFSAITK